MRASISGVRAAEVDSLPGVAIGLAVESAEGLVVTGCTSQGEFDVHLKRSRGVFSTE